MTTIALSSNTSWYIYNFRRNTINRLLEDGFDVVVIAPKDDYSMRLVVMGVQYIDIDIDQGGTNPFKHF